MLSQYNVYPTLTPVRVVANSNQTGTYVNGPLNNGVGSTFTYATGVLTIDSVTVNLGDRVLLAGQSAANQNGIYFCTVQGAVGVAAILTRSADQHDIGQLLLGQTVSVFAGTDGAGSEYVLVEPFPIQMGISNLEWTSSAGADGPLGTAATKAASNNALSSVASVTGATVANALAVFADVAGTVKAASATTTLGQTLAITGGLSATTGLTATSVVLPKGTGTESSNAVTINQPSGVITSASLTTAQYASEVITLTNSFISTTSVVLVTVMGGTNTTKGIAVSATAAAGTSVINVTNLNSAALNGNVILGFAVF
jgi:hypothetical protein